MATYTRPLWLEKDGKRSLYAAKDVADARANGWGDPEGTRPNGEKWNPPIDEDQRTQLDAIESVTEARGEVQAKQAKREEKARADALAASEKAAADAPVEADLKVQVVEPTKAKTKK